MPEFFGFEISMEMSKETPAEAPAVRKICCASAG